MIPLGFAPARRPLEVLCLGAHCDDIEIGCGATLLRLLGERRVNVSWVILTSTPQRAAEARRAALRYRRAARAWHMRVESLRDGFLPEQWGDAKRIFESLKALPRPDVVFTHHGEDRHQDHRLVAELTWNTFRDHVILEYEVPKYDGGLVSPNLFVPVTRRHAELKVRTLMTAFASQHGKPWFSADTFNGLMRLRGIECNAPQGLAEGFHARKLVL